jgi:hypothetical protein
MNPNVSSFLTAIAYPPTTDTPTTATSTTTSLLPRIDDAASFIATDMPEPTQAHDGADALDGQAEALPGIVEPTGQTTIDAANALSEPPPPHNPVLPGLFDHKALFEIVGPSKTRKSFAVLQLGLCLAAGRAVFGFEGGRRFSVCIADLELSQDDIKRRVWRMGRALGIGPDDIEGRLRILPLAGTENVRAAIEQAAEGFDVLICDPLYALCDGAETIENFREPLRWLRKQAVNRVACGFVHHDAKGTPGDRDARDRGSGANITGRSVDARITLTPAAADPENSVVMGFMCRSYATPAASAWTFQDDAFRTGDVPVEPLRQADRMRQSRPKLANFTEAAIRILNAEGPMSPATFKHRLRDDLKLSKGDADTLTAGLCEDDGPARRWRTGGFTTAYRIGTKEQHPPASRCFPRDRQETGETR